MSGPLHETINVATYGDLTEAHDEICKWIIDNMPKVAKSVLLGQIESIEIVDIRLQVPLTTSHNGPPVGYADVMCWCDVKRTGADGQTLGAWNRDPSEPSHEIIIITVAPHIPVACAMIRRINYGKAAINAALLISPTSYKTPEDSTWAVVSPDNTHEALFVYQGIGFALGPICHTVAPSS